jgi:hypothetical protein
LTISCKKEPPSLDNYLGQFAFNSKTDESIILIAHQRTCQLCLNQILSRTSALESVFYVTDFRQTGVLLEMNISKNKIQTENSVEALERLSPTGELVLYNFASRQVKRRVNISKEAIMECYALIEKQDEGI